MHCPFLRIATFAACAVQLWGWETPDVKQAFEQFVKDFGRRYDGNETRTRFAAFAENLAFLHAENAKGHSYELGITEHADMTYEEFVKRGYCEAPAGEESRVELGYFGEHLEGSVDDLPASVNWVLQGAVTPVRNQGQCNSCWTFASAGALEGSWKIASGKLVPLSEEQLMDCARPGTGCAKGGRPENSYTYAQTNGICTDATYPYVAKQSACGARCTVGLPSGAVTGFLKVMPNEFALASAVVQQPVSLAVESSSQVWQHYQGGIINGFDCGSKVDHAVLLVGYGETMTTQGFMKYWIVKNSYGARWGIGGYVWIARGGGGVGMCGIHTDPTVPVVKLTTSLVGGAAPGEAELSLSNAEEQLSVVNV